MKKDHPHDTLTPQRKHRKLLKDGSGVEVWPEAIEKTFVQGLREYWQSPYATYTQSRGRSRWRNQFLVDYLQRHGIQRTKKQVASHIQVLRNMWKGQPEFHLVAGGDEQIDPVTHTPIKEEHGDVHHLSSFDWDDRESSHSASPDFSPPDSQADFPLTPEQNLFSLDPTGFKQEMSPGSLYFHSTQQLSSPTTSPHGLYTAQLPDYSAVKVQPAQPAYAFPHSAATTSSPRYAQNRVSTLFLVAEGMTPFSVNVDALAANASPRPVFTLRIKLSVPLLNDARSPPTMHGFTASVAVASVWSSSAKCTTKVMAGSVCIFEESESLQFSHLSGNGAVHAILPDSSLNRCRWLDPNTATTLTQELVVDDQVLLYLIYDLDRKNGFMPSASFLGFQHYKLVDKSSPMASSAVPPQYPTSSSSRRQPSASYTLAPNPYSIPIAR